MKKHPFYEYEISQLLQGLTPSFGLTRHHHGYVKRTQTTKSLILLIHGCNLHISLTTKDMMMRTMMSNASQVNGRHL